MRDSFDSGKMPCPQRARHLGDLPGPALPRGRQGVPDGIEALTHGLLAPEAGENGAGEIHPD